MKTEWTEQENTFLREAYPQRDWPSAAIAEKLGRSIPAIRQQARVLGIKRPRYSLDYAAIENLMRQNKSAQEIGAALGYSYQAAFHAMNRIKGEAETEQWQQYEIDYLAAVYPDTSVSIDEITKTLERSRSAVYQAAALYGFKRASTNRRLDYGKVAALVESGLNDAEIARQMGCSQSGICRARKIVMRGAA